ncbi:MAG TPA: hypothetical protein P5318_16655 [Candidatus Hydrogenedentes bacterium]|nr:hypothetical protein [Candidatus Hydrogenedentota bacterium]HPC17847.1 hypothetical protein [Candidatus Hydrogenedentota bacterium]HRT21748.1 hypothetical protein [Candidatus Hydrogenedentota bacterium]HRT65527.1 hypothetical protein [Candidatus Hydrogenedentota bacterium]
MATHEAKLRADLARLQTLHEQAKAALANVVDLLDKADARRAKEGERRWGRIVDNLEGALQLAKAKVTGYEQRIRECEQHLEALARASVGTGPKPLLEFVSAEFEDVIPEGMKLPPDHLAAAQRILGMSLDDLGGLTLEQVADMNAQLYEEPPEPPKPPSPPEPERTRSALDERIEHAKEIRESLAARRSNQPPSFAERRRQKVLRDAIAKVMNGKIQTLDFEEVEMLVQCYNGIEERPDKSDNDTRLQAMLGRFLPAIQERASELRRKRAQTYRGRPY